MAEKINKAKAFKKKEFEKNYKILRVSSKETWIEHEYFIPDVDINSMFLLPKLPI